MGVEQGGWRFSEFSMDVRVLAARMVMAQRANPWEPKRQDKHADQGDDKASRLESVCSQGLHVALTLLLRAQMFPSCLRPLPQVWMLAADRLSQWLPPLTRHCCIRFLVCISGQVTVWSG